MVSHPLNMSCGQTDLHPNCLGALARQVGTPIYYPPYWELELETIGLLRRLMHTQNDVLLITHGLGDLRRGGSDPEPRGARPEGSDGEFRCVRSGAYGPGEHHRGRAYRDQR